MGNRLSGLLAELFIDKVQKETFAHIGISPPTFRYVDDLLLFTRGEEEANTVFAAFNNNVYGLKFTLELPDINNTIPFLDFKVRVTDVGETIFDFHRKNVRKDNFVNAQTALPKNAINSIVRQEWVRIRNRCSDVQTSNKHLIDFENRLYRNKHNVKALKLNSPTTTRGQNFNPGTQQTFFLNIPFVSNDLEQKIRKSIRGLGVKIIISHKASQLKQVLTKPKRHDQCKLPNCRLKNNLCLIKGSVYQVKCNKCHETYIGSTWRHLHIRYKEHLSHRASPIYAHNLRCDGLMVLSVLAKDNNTQRMRIKEALLIKELKPSLNKKDDLFKSHILFE
jgi:hypothetical protein